MANWVGGVGDDTHSAYTEGEDSEHVQYQSAGGNDSITGGYIGDYLDGGDGNDTCEGRDGGDDISVGDGNDQAYGDSGDDYINYGAGQKYLNGGTGDDTFRPLMSVTASTTVTILGERGDDYVYMSIAHETVNGGAGQDRIDYLDMTSAVGVNLLTNVASGAALGDSWTQVEDVTGTNFADYIVGSGYSNFLEGEFGNDTIEGGEGGDELDGGQSTDTLSYLGSDLGVTVDLGTGRASGGDAQGDVFRNFENVVGSALRDVLNGSSIANGLAGLGGDDSLAGKVGNDTLSGGDGNDRLLGGIGADNLTGGAGADKFIFQAGDSTAAARDTITDFVRTQGDKIDLSLIDANTGANGDQKFTFIDTQAFHGVAGELRYLVSGTVAYVLGDVNGDKSVDVSIAVSNVASFAGTDFIL